MALYYQILPTKNIPSEVLTYSYEKQLKIGQMVKILVREKLYDGVVFDFIDEENLMFDKQKTKSIIKILPFALKDFHLKFLKLISFNTFNSKNSLLQSFFIPINYLTKKNWIDLENTEIQEKENINDEDINLDKETNDINLENDKNNISVQFELESDYLVRIINLIRSQISIKQGSSPVNFLIIFPEQKLLDKIFEKLFKEFDETKQINLYKYSNNGNKEAKYTARKLILDSTLNQGLNSTSYNNEINIFLSTRSGIFLPFVNLEKIILIDEANSMYIQEQNSIYFDTRDIIYLMAKSYGCDLIYLSSLPSLRLFKNYKEEGIINLLNDQSYKEKTDFNVRITNLNPQDKTQLISQTVEDILNDEDNQTYFEEEPS